MKQGTNNSYIGIIDIKWYCLGQTRMDGHLASMILWPLTNDTN